MPEREILQRENFVVAVFSPAILKQFPPNLSCEGSLSFKVTTSTGSTAADFQEPQAFLEHTLEEMGRKFDVSVYIDVSDEQVVKRLSERRVCHQCRAEFHLLSDPFGTCPRKKCTGEFLRHLEEDQSEVIAILVKMFQRGIEPLLQHYETSGRLIEIGGDGSIDEVHVAIVQALMPYR